MLVLTRKLGEQIKIGDGITVTVLSVGKTRVKLGFAAPPETPVVRKELADSRPCEHSTEARCLASV